LYRVLGGRWLVGAGLLTSGLVVAATLAGIPASASVRPVAAAKFSPVTSGSLAAAAQPTMPVGGNPWAGALDPATNTLYVVNEGDGTVSVVNTRTCNAGLASGCAGTAPTTPVGGSPDAIVIDQATNTVYVGNGDGTISVIDGATCNATDLTGCARAHPLVAVQGLPGALIVSSPTHTLYVGGTGSPAVLSVINTAYCNAAVTTGCGHQPTAVPLPRTVASMALDPGTHTLYLQEYGQTYGSGQLVLVDATTCNAGVRSGCTRPSAVVRTTPNYGSLVLDESAHTLYFEGRNSSNMAVLTRFDTRSCNAGVGSGCASAAWSRLGIQVAGAVMAVSHGTHAIYVAGGWTDNNVYVLDEARCNATAGSCGVLGLMRLGPKVTPDGSANVSSLVVAQAHDTLYTVNQGGNSVSALDEQSCSGVTQRGCTVLAPTFGTSGTGTEAVTVNSATGSLYVTSGADDNSPIDVISACSPQHIQVCRLATSLVPSLMVYNSAITIDPISDSLYVLDGVEGYDGVINGVTCNAHVITGCRPSFFTFPDTVGAVMAAVSPTTHTLYVGGPATWNGGPALVTVTSTLTCNAHHTSGCGHPVATLNLGGSTGLSDLVVDPATNTLYVSDGGNSVWVINAATCNASATTGCSTPVAVVHVGSIPSALAVDDSTHTLYVTNSGDNTVSVINTATCDATDTAGCGPTPPTFAVGTTPSGIAVDAARGVVYVANSADWTISAFPASTCSAVSHTNCSPTNTMNVGVDPSALAVDTLTHSVYVVDLNQGTISVLQ
jgi:YVTN family beta-propeller protein